MNDERLFMRQGTVIALVIAILPVRAYGIFALSTTYPCGLGPPNHESASPSTGGTQAEGAKKVNVLEPGDLRYWK